MRPCTAWVLALSLGGLSAGCGTLPLLVSPEVRPVARTGPSSFTVDGRLGLGDGGRAAHVEVFWTSSPGGEQVDFISPLGQVLARANWSVGAVPQMRLADGRVVEGQALEVLMDEQFGGALPLLRLRDWLLAVPSTDARLLEIDSVGRPLRLSERGWVISYPEYVDASPEALPRSIQGESGERYFRFSVSDWEL